jgi:multicomponent Na+:H+ antiporter subunit D
LGGSWSKWFLGLGAAEAQQPLLVAVLMISSLLNIAYLMPIVVRGFFFTPQDSAERPGIQEAPLFCLVPLCITAAGGIALFLCADRVYHWLTPIAPLLPH